VKDNKTYFNMTMYNPYTSEAVFQGSASSGGDAETGQDLVAGASFFNTEFKKYDIFRPNFREETFVLIEGRLAYFTFSVCSTPGTKI
jgi:hypothetical protein